MKRIINTAVMSVFALALTAGVLTAANSEKEDDQRKIAYLGVSTSPVDPGLSEHLGLPEGVGLSVDYIDKSSGAHGVLQRNDILHKLDDQLLVTHHQLAVLVRSRKPGDEVQVSVIRKGKPVKLKIKLGGHEYSPLRAHNWNIPNIRIQSPQSLRRQPKAGNPNNYVFGFGSDNMDDIMEQIRGQINAMQDDNFTKGSITEMLENMLGGTNLPFDVQMHGNTQDEEDDEKPTSNVRTHISTSSTAVYTTVMNGIVATLRIEDGSRYFTLKDSKGKVIFDGPVNTDEEKEKVPKEYRGRLEQIENKQVRDLNSKSISLQLKGPDVIDEDIDIDV